MAAERYRGGAICTAAQNNFLKWVKASKPADIYTYISVKTPIFLESFTILYCAASAIVFLPLRSVWQHTK